MLFAETKPERAATWVCTTAGVRTPRLAVGLPRFLLAESVRPVLYEQAGGSASATARFVAAPMACCLLGNKEKKGDLRWKVVFGEAFQWAYQRCAHPDLTAQPSCAYRGGAPRTRRRSRRRRDVLVPTQTSKPMTNVFSQRDAVSCEEKRFDLCRRLLPVPERVCFAPRSRCCFLCE